MKHFIIDIISFGAAKAVGKIVSNGLGNLEGTMAKNKFIWDSGNTRHIFDEHAERELTKEEIESVFLDENKIIREDVFNEKYNEMEYICIGKGRSGIVRFVVFSVRDGRIRPGTARTANADADGERQAYYDNIR